MDDITEDILNLTLAGRKPNACHEGYQYQDLLTAFVLADVLMARDGTVTVESKAYAGDKFDDIIFSRPGKPVRRFQIKWVVDENTFFAPKLIRTSQRNLRIDHLLACTPMPHSDEELWLIAPWLPPQESTDEALDWLPVSDTEGIFNHFGSQTFQLNPESLWPKDRHPTVKAIAEAKVTRETYLRFCSRFFIELNAPRMSGRLWEPGDLERLLLEKMEAIGIGRHPNGRRKIQDVAALLVGYATRLRATGGFTDWNETARVLNLRTDYGRIDQPFSFDRKRYVFPREAVKVILASVEATPITVVTAPPGQGKSWILTDIAEALSRLSVSVVSHYCYLQPTDAELEFRITKEALYSNLVAGIASFDPQAVGGGFSADFQVLANAVQKWGQRNPQSRLLLIIDGLDNALRAQRAIPHLPKERVLLAEDLSLLFKHLPANVRILIGSQPGAHLNPIHELPAGNVSHVEISPWGSDDIKKLVTRHVSASGIRSTEDFGGVVAAKIARLAQGNPLYGYFLVNALTKAKLPVFSEEAINNFFEQTPAYKGDLTRYYRYLYDGLAEDNERRIADLLGVLEFSVTEQELIQIFRQPEKYVKSALQGLASVLEYVSAEGGFKVYHESFRRFIFDGIERDDPNALLHSLEQVATWLEKECGFPRDARSFRFLLPTLRRSGQSQKVFGLVNRRYLRDSVAEGHPESAIRLNISHAADVAAETQEWTALIRLAEFQKTAETCFEERLNLGYMKAFSRAYCAARGPSVLASRLLFDGRPSYNFDVGISLCAICFNMGGVPPWKIYYSGLESHKVRVKDTHEFERKEAQALAEDLFLARLQTLGLHAAVENNGWASHIDVATPGYMYTIADHVYNEHGLNGLRFLATQVDDRAFAVVHIRLAEAFAADNRLMDAEESALRAIDSDQSLVICSHAARFLQEAQKYFKLLPSDWAISVAKLMTGNYVDREEFAFAWYGSRLAAYVDQNEFQRVISTLSDGGRFRSLMRFIFEIAEAESRTSSRPAEEVAFTVRDILKTFANAPLRSAPDEPRTIDLHGFPQELVRRSLKRAWALTAGSSVWPEAMQHIDKIVNESRWSSNFGIFGSIASPTELVEILNQYAKHPDQKEAIALLADRWLQYAEVGNDVYDAAIEGSLASATAWGYAQEPQIALKRLRKTARYLCSYGYRKDSALWDVLEPLDALAIKDRTRGRRAIRRTQPLTDVVTVRTDGKVTRHAPNAWFEKLLLADPEHSIYLLANTMRMEANQFDWRLETAYAQATQLLCGKVDPLLAFYLGICCPCPESGIFSTYLSVVEALLEKNRNSGVTYFNMLAAHLEDESTDRRADWHEHFSLLQAFAKKHQLCVPMFDAQDKLKDPPIDATEEVQPRAQFNPSTVSEAISMLSLVDKFTGLRSMQYDSESLSALILDWLESNPAETEGFLRLLPDFLRGQQGASFCAALARGLQETDRNELAVELLVRTYTHIRCDSWMALAGRDFEFLVQNAYGINQALARENLAMEVAGIVKNGGRVSTTYGLTQHLIALFLSLGQEEEAFKLWEEAFLAIRSRLKPSVSIGEGAFVPYQPALYQSASLDDVATILLVSRCCSRNMRWRENAMFGFGEMVTLYPEQAARAMQWLMQLDTTSMVIQLLLDVAYAHEQAPYRFTHVLEAELLQISNDKASFLVSAKAHAMLKRAAG